MDTLPKNHSKSHPNSAPHIITLDSAQYFFYQTHQLEIQAPDGRHLDFISKARQTEPKENRLLRLRDQVALVNCLFRNINDECNFSVPAVLGMTDLLGRIEEACCQGI